MGRRYAGLKVMILVALTAVALTSQTATEQHRVRATSNAAPGVAVPEAAPAQDRSEPMPEIIAAVGAMKSELSEALPALDAVAVIDALDVVAGVDLLEMPAMPEAMELAIEAEAAAKALCEKEMRRAAEHAAHARRVEIRARVAPPAERWMFEMSPRPGG